MLLPELFTAISIRQTCNYQLSIKKTHGGIGLAIHNRDGKLQRSCHALAVHTTGALRAWQDGLQSFLLSRRTSGHVQGACDEQPASWRTLLSSFPSPAPSEVGRVAM